MSGSECDSKIQKDLKIAIRDNATRECRFEPDWRPTHSSADRPLHIEEVLHSEIIVAIDGKGYRLRNSVCQGDCSVWHPEAGRDYSVSITYQPKYLNACLRKMLPARRDVCVGFGATKKVAHADSTPSEFTVCYSVPGN
jgi:hypothetical protein